MTGIAFSISLKEQKVSFHWSLVALLFWSASNYLSPIYVFFGFFTSISIVFIHEIGHFLAAKSLGFDVYDIVIHCWGGFCSHEEVYYKREDLIISASGVIAQTVLGTVAFLVFIILNEIFDISNPIVQFVFIRRFIFHNLIIIGINLLPFPGFDGHTIWRNLDFSKKDRVAPNWRTASKSKKKFSKVKRKKYSKEEISEIRKEIVNSAIKRANDTK